MFKVVFVLSSVLKKCIKFALSIKCLMFIRLIGGCECNQLFEDLKMSRIFTVYIIMANTFFPLVFLWSGSPSSYLSPPFYFYYDVFEHYSLIYISIYTQEQYFPEYITGIRHVEATMRLSAPIEDETPVTRLINIIIYLRIAIHIKWCYAIYNDGNTNDLIVFMCRTFLQCSKDMAGLPILFMLEIFRHRLEILKLSTKQYFQQEHFRSKLLKIKRIVYIYKNLFDVLEQRFNIFKLMVTFRFVAEFRYFMGFVYLVISDLIEKRQVKWIQFTTFVPMKMLITILPPLLFEMSVDQVDGIRIILADQLLICPDEEVRVALYDALIYLRVRRLRCVVWRVLDIDASTPLTFISLVTNYVTVMIQFMKPQIESVDSND